MTATRQLLLEIARCPVVAACKAGEEHPCSTIVRVQQVPLERYQVPEPWNGHIDTAPILFVSSNPSIDYEGPTVWASSDADLVDTFAEAFDGTRPGRIRDGSHVVQADGSAGGSVHYWAWIRNRATELLARPARGGIDYALTEVVRCKSRGEEGVRDAFPTCTDRYLDRTLAQSPARVVVLVGAFARAAAIERWRLQPDELVAGPRRLAGHHRYLAVLDHPSGFGGRKSFAQSPTEVAELRAFLTA